MRTAVALLSGVLFGAGLALGGMTNPAIVLGFLDVAGAWDPSLAFVMGGALLVAAAFQRLARQRGRTWWGEPLPAPPASGIDARLISGAALFGLGWGLAGFCPGPALASLVTGSGSVLLFVVAMAGGMLLFRPTLRRARADAGEIAQAR